MLNEFIPFYKIIYFTLCFSFMIMSCTFISIFRINNSNIEIVWSDNISIREKDYSIQALKEINLQDRIKGEKIFLSRYCDTTNDFIVKDNLNNKIILETI